MPDPINAGVDFASRLASNVYGLHKQEQDRDRADQERQRQSMLTILESAAQSGNVNPEDMPALYSKLFELNGAKAKEVAALTPHLQAAFTQADTPRTSTFTHQSQVPGQTIGTGDFQTEVPAFSLPPIPTTETINTPAIRLMSPEEKANRVAQSQVAAMRTTYPQRKKELDEANQRKLELQGAALDAKEQARINAITTKGGIDAAKKFNERVNMFMYQAGGDLEVAKGLASKSMIADEDAALAYKQQQTKVGEARIANMKGRLDVARQNAATLARRADIYAKAVEQAGTLAASGKGDAAARRNLETYKASTRELYSALTPLNNAIVKLKIDPANSDNGVLDPAVAAQVADLEQQRDAIKAKLDAARTTWLPSMPEPTESVVPAVPQQSNAGAATQSKGLIRRANLGAVRTQNPSLAGLDDNALVQYLQLHGYTVK